MKERKKERKKEIMPSCSGEMLIHRPIRQKCMLLVDEKRREDSFVRCCRERIPHMPNILM